MQPAVNHADLTLSGRDLARMRRQAMATEGKVGAAKRVAAAVRATHVAQAAQAAAQRDEAQCGCAAGADAVCACSASASLGVAVQPAKANSALPNGRVLARARRQTLALEGKVGIQKVVNASRIAATMPDRADWQTALVQGATGRQRSEERRVGKVSR